MPTLPIRQDAVFPLKKDIKTQSSHMLTELNQQGLTLHIWCVDFFGTKNKDISSIIRIDIVLLQCTSGQNMQ